jgi:hypothetical protein
MLLAEIAPHRKPRLVTTKYVEPTETALESFTKELLAAVKRDFAEVDYFTREDCLHIVGESIATITRYQYLCLAMQNLIDRREVIPMTRTDLCLPKMAKRYGQASSQSIGEQYDRVISRIIHKHFPPGEEFNAMSVVNYWTTDNHLTRNAKRVTARACLNLMVRDGRIGRVTRHHSFRRLA